MFSLAWIKFKQSSISISNLEANLNFTFCPKGSIVIPSCSERKGYKELMKRIPRIFNYIFKKNRRNLEIDIIMADMSIIQFIFNLHLSSIRRKQFLSRLFIEFSHTQDIINNVTRNFPVTSHSTIKSTAQVKAQVLTYPLVQAFMPCPTTFAKPSVKSRRNLPSMGLVKLP